MFLKNNVVLHIVYVPNRFNCYLRPFLTTIRLARLLELKKKFFHKSGRNPADLPRCFFTKMNSEKSSTKSDKTKSCLNTL